MARSSEDGSQRELRALTGRPLQAQEAERRRIALELHDDLNQSLALLAVEMDLLGQNPPRSGDLLSDRMHELSGRVKDLSSAVHGLSHFTVGALRGELVDRVRKAIRRSDGPLAGTGGHGDSCLLQVRTRDPRVQSQSPRGVADRAEGGMRPDEPGSQE